MPYDITFALGLFNYDRDPEESIVALRALADALMQIDINYLRRHPNVPLLYRSGVRYEAEKNGMERWQDISTTLQKQKGDCEDLACWRAAELNVRMGIAAFPNVYVTQRLPDGRRLYHVTVVVEPNGAIEDPSAILGMNEPPQTSLVSKP